MTRLRSSVYTVPADALPEMVGYVLGTRSDLPLPADEQFDFPRHVLHTAPGVPPPANVAQVIVDGSQTPWLPEEVGVGWPNGSRYVLEATWLDESGAMQRTKMVDVPAGITPLETNIVPHMWAGDGADL